MKKLSFVLALLVMGLASMHAEVVFNEEHDVAGWNAQQLPVANYPVLANAGEGDVIVITVTAVEDGARICKSSIRCKVEHVFAVVKGMFRYRKTRLRGLPKVDAQLHMLFALANLVLADRPSVTA